jgi:N-acetylglucosamine-6-phosphate deacetylase
MTRRAFIADRLFDGERMTEGLALVVEDGKVAALLPASDVESAERIALGTRTIAPGFVDLQVNGGGGFMLGDCPTVAGMRDICAVHGRLGATGLLPTLITDTPETTRRVVEAGIAATEEGVPGFLGLHLEGPHLDPRRPGAHPVELIRRMDAADLAFLCEAARALPVLKVTLAPESVTRGQVVELVRAGAIVSLGHTDVDFSRAKGYFEAGARCVTHLFNAMSPLGHREPGLVGAALDAEVYCGLIADGMHVRPEVMRIALAAKKGRDTVFLVSDAMAHAGTKQTAFRLGGRWVLRRGGRLTLEDGTLAGADIDLARAVQTLVMGVGVEEARALKMATSIPASLIGAGDRLGVLKPGCPADFVALDTNFALCGVWRGGVGLLSDAP